MRHGISLLVPALVIALPAAAQTKADAEAIVKKAIAFAKTNGEEKALHEISNPNGQFKNGTLYIFVYDLNGNVMAHGANASMIGKNLINTRDVDGNLYILNLVNIGKIKGQGWLSFKFPNPVTHKIEPKIAFVEKYGNLIYGSGIYAI
jgi:signal transduction histidine kinase